MSKILRWLGLSILRLRRHERDVGQVMPGCNPWAEGKWVVFSRGEIVAWFEDELAAREYAELL